MSQARRSEHGGVSMKVQKWTLSLVGAALVVAGSLVWMSRFDYSLQGVLDERLGDRLIEVNALATTNLTEACDYTRTYPGWILFVMDANLVSDSEIRTYFETAEEPEGLWVEYDNGLLRLGMGLGPQSVESNTEIPIRWVRRGEAITVAIGISLDETRVVTNAVDKVSQWPGAYYPEWSCETVRVGGADRRLSEGYRCPGCNVRLRYATGSDIEELSRLLDDLSNVQEFNMRRWLGSALTLVGLVLLIRSQFRVSPLRYRRATSTADRESSQKSEV
jgi:hypothetical protein